jgi:hypothetical protein
MVKTGQNVTLIPPPGNKNDLFLPFVGSNLPIVELLFSAINVKHNFDTTTMKLMLHENEENQRTDYIKYIKN